MKSRFARSVQKIDQWCRKNRHKPIREQWKELCIKVRGHYGYYGITGNVHCIRKFLYQVERSWRRWLDRRNSKRSFTWEKFKDFLARYSLPIPEIVHSVFKGKWSERKVRSKARFWGAVCDSVRTHGSVGVLGEQSPKTTQWAAYYNGSAKPCCSGLFIARISWKNGNAHASFKQCIFMACPRKSALRRLVRIPLSPRFR